MLIRREHQHTRHGRHWRFQQCLPLLALLLASRSCQPTAAAPTPAPVATPAAARAGGTPVAGATVVIRQLPDGQADTQLLDALSNRSISTILLASDYEVGSQFDQFSGPWQDGVPMLPVQRNITIASVPGLQPQPMLDLSYKLSVLNLCDTCWVTLANITVKDERMGANAQFDFFLGEGNSVVWAINVVRNRRSCTDPGTAVKLVGITKRSPRFLGPNGSPNQTFALEDFEWRGSTFPRTLHLVNYSAEFPRHYNGGYSVLLTNVRRLCHNYVDPSCLGKSDADYCVSQDMERLIAGQQAGSSGSGLSKGATAGIAVAVALAVLAAGGLVCWRRQQRQSSGTAYTSSKSRHVLSDDGDVEEGGNMSSGGPQGAAMCDVGLSKDRSQKDGGRLLRQPAHKPDGGGGSGSGAPGERCSSSSGTSGPYNSNHPLLPAQLLPGSTASLNRSLSVMSGLHFGNVLGSGSFGRVYKARLGDYDVAVKVIEHYSSMSAAVQNEATLMLSCRHPNVVAAYHYITKNHSQLGTGTGATGDSSDASFCTAVERVLLSSITDHQQQQGGSGGNGAAVAAGTGGSIEHPSRGSNNSMDKPIPVLPGLKIVRKAYQASELEVWPSSSSAPQQQEQPHTDDFLTNSSSVNAAPLYASSSSLASSGGTGGGGTAGDQRHQQPQQQQSQQGVAQGRDSSSSGVVEAVESSLLKWQNEGGFWPAGPSALLEQQQHPVDDEADDSLVTTWLIQEYCDSGTLGKQANSWLPSTEDDAQMIKRLVLLQDVARGLSYLHGKNIVHGDLNARNVLVTTCASAPCGLTAKLADLGLSRTIKQHNTHHTTCTVGTMSHMPPEMLRLGQMTCGVDVYAFGILMWEVWTREIAFKDLHYGQFFETVVLRDQRPPVPPNMPEDYRVLMEHCWSAEPSARPSSKALLECIGLMIADRQHSLGLPVQSSIGTVDREFSRHGGGGSATASGDGAGGGAGAGGGGGATGGVVGAASPSSASISSGSRAVLHKLSAHHMLQHQQQQQAQQHQVQQRNPPQRQPTPARMPPPARQQQVRVVTCGVGDHNNHAAHVTARTSPRQGAVVKVSSALASAQHHQGDAGSSLSSHQQRHNGDSSSIPDAAAASSSYCQQQQQPQQQRGHSEQLESGGPVSPSAFVHDL